MQSSGCTLRQCCEFSLALIQLGSESCSSMKSVVVTGVSSGIGWGTAKVLVNKGVHVFGSVRKAKDAERLSAEFGDAFTPLLFDVTDEGNVRKAVKQVRDRLNGQTLFGLVNNAGIALSAPLMYQSVDEYRFQLEVNLVGPLIVTQTFLPLLGADRSLRGAPGRIINMSSIGGKIGGPFLGSYAASKHGIEGFSESLRRELMLYGIDVIIVGPGSVATPIWDKAEATDVSHYDKTEYAKAFKKFRDYMIHEGRNGYPPERIGEAIWKALTVPNPRTRYAVVPQRLLNWTLPMALPTRIVDKLIGGQFGLRRS